MFCILLSHAWTRTYVKQETTGKQTHTLWCESGFGLSVGDADNRTDRGYKPALFFIKISGFGSFVPSHL